MCFRFFDMLLSQKEKLKKMTWEEKILKIDGDILLSIFWKLSKISMASFYLWRRNERFLNPISPSIMLGTCFTCLTKFWVNAILCYFTNKTQVQSKKMWAEKKRKRPHEWLEGGSGVLGLAPPTYIFQITQKVLKGYYIQYR